MEGARGRAQPSPGVGVPVAVLPRHVEQCARAGGRGWSVWVWRKNNPDVKTRLQYTCKSWRHKGNCARAAAAQLFARLKEALDPIPANECSFWVLTLDRDGYYSGKPWANAEVAYKSLGHMSERFIKRLRRLCIRHGWGSFKSEWVQVVEAHRSGWPHVNLIIHNKGLAKYLEDEQRTRKANGASENGSRLIRDEFLGHAVECGWGERSTAEPVKSRDAMAGYLTKLAANADEHMGELAKITQAPTNAPVRFRRLRSGKGFLPPCRKNPQWTGALVRRYYDPEWGYVAQAFRGKKTPTPPERNQELIGIEAIETEAFVQELQEDVRQRYAVRWKGTNRNGLPPQAHFHKGVLRKTEPLDAFLPEGKPSDCTVFNFREKKCSCQGR